MNTAAVTEYLKYMESLGYWGFELEHSPFASQVEAPAPAVRLTPPTRPQAVRKAPPPPSPAAESPGLFSVLDIADATSPTDDMRRKANTVMGRDQAEILRNLYQVFHNCEACALGTTRRRFVFGEGHYNADLMLVGEAPGAEEDQTGRPFVGAAGQLLDKIIEAMGLRREQVFIANVVKCRPPENRMPLSDETATCSPILAKQIETVKPKVIVALGSSALRYFAGPQAAITRMRGHFIEWQGYQVMPTLHPAYLLRNPTAKRDVWADMQKVMARLKGA
jgi:DNA polymerase